jgi:hypothetical protein
MPAGHTLNFTIPGSAHNSTIDQQTGVFSAGQTAGQVTVRVSDSQSSNSNYDEIAITIT